MLILIRKNGTPVVIQTRKPKKKPKLRLVKA